MRSLGIIGALIIVLALALPAYAETQSVKISGDLTIRGISRDNFDLNAQAKPDGEHFFMSTVELQVDADLTDNVSTVVRIVNQRNWGDSDRKELRDLEDSAGTNRIVVGHSLLDLGVDLAYVQIRELIFEPVTLRLGRQDLWYGRGLIIGCNQRDPGFVEVNIPVVLMDADRGIGSPELTAYNSFDAARLIVDFEKYAPFVVDLVYAKIDEEDVEGGGDTNLYGINAGYRWNVYNAEAEAYYWLKHGNGIGNPFFADDDSVNTVGIRGSFMPNEEFIFGGEAAYQFGEYVRSSDQRGERERSAYMLNLFTEYLGWTKYLYSPKIGAEWIFTSGDRDPELSSGTYGAWNPMFRGHYPLLIRPFQGLYYITSRFPMGEDLGLTNQHEFILTGSIKPLDDVTFQAAAAQYYFHQTPPRGRTLEPAALGGHYAGTELDFTTTYDYTEDVTFSLLTAWYFPSDEVYGDQGVSQYPNSVTGNPADNTLTPLHDAVASEVIGSCKVSF